LVPSSDEAAAEADMGPQSPENPVAIGAAFLSLVTAPDGPDVEDLKLLVTPESWPHWGDFRSVAEMLDGCGMATRATPSDSDPNVVYIKYVTDHDGQLYQAQNEMMFLARAVATTVWRPELRSWRIHGVGDYLRPDEVPH
jgi:hypothetical protein